MVSTGTLPDGRVAGRRVPPERRDWRWRRGFLLDLFFYQFAETAHDVLRTEDPAELFTQDGRTHFE